MHLTSHSYYSLRYGTMAVETLAEEAAAKGISMLALTDINNTTGMMDFIKACKEQKIKPAAGADIRNGNDHLYTLLARNNNGFREINEFITRHNLSQTEYPPEAPVMPDVYTIYPLGAKPFNKLLENEYAGIRPSEVSRLVSLQWQRHPSKLVIRHPASFARRGEYDLHLNLRAINNNILLTRLTPGQVASPLDCLVAPDTLRKEYELYPQLIRNTEKLLDECHITMDFSSIKNKKTFTGNRYDDKELLEKLAQDGLEYRYGRHNKLALERVRHELGIIDRLGFSAYFLITWDIIRYSMSRGFYHVGRGSGANSVVAYCLRITDVDPIELDLYFERFINPRRTSPPDFDIDYSWKERDQVQDYIFKRYGHKHTALLGAMSTFKTHSILRELGKVHGLPKQEIDDLLKEPDKVTNQNSLVEKIKQIGLQMEGFPNIRSIHAGGILISEEPLTCYVALDLPPKGFPTTQWDMYVAEDLGFEKLDILSQRGIGHIKECVDIIRLNRGLSIDVHRVEVFKKDPKVKDQLKRAETNGCFYIESPAMRGLLTKLRCDNYLSLVAASSIIRPGVAKSGMMREYVHRFHHPNDFTYIHPVMKEQLQETYGVMVYQEDVLKICHHFAGLDLADADVLRRAMSGKHRSKKELERIVEKFFSNCKSYGYPDEVTKEVWRQIESFAGYSFSKAHSASYAVESFQSLYLKSHYPLEFMVAVINNFGGFYPGWVYFNEARRCGANIELPCVNRSDYTTNIYGDQIFIGFIHIANLESELAKSIVSERQCNGNYLNMSDFIERVQPGIEQLIILIRTGALRFTGKSKATLMWEGHLEGRRQKAEGRREGRREGRSFVETGHGVSSRDRTDTVGGQPEFCRDTIHRVQLFTFPGSEQSAVGSGQSAVGSEQSAVGSGQSAAGSQGSCQLSIINCQFTKTFTLPQLEYDPLEDAYDEIELLGFPVTMTYFDLLMTPFRGEIMAREMTNRLGKVVRMVGSLVTIKYVRTVKKEWMHFAAFLDNEGEFFDTVHFPDSLRQYPFRGQGVYLILGLVVEEFGFPSVNVLKMAKLPFKKDPRRE
ncbi:MAG: DNA polymerase III subunit alpha [Bacteroidetes bacterium]|nr:DNA polymerase III subunit alpha [Bacteroidota bacterium]